MVEGSTEAVILPSLDYMDTAKVLSWIAYGKALPKPQWNGHLFKLSRDWKFHDHIGEHHEYNEKRYFDYRKWYFGSCNLKEIFRARAFGSRWPTIIFIRTEEGLEHAEKYLSQFEVSDASGWTALFRQLNADIKQRDVVLDAVRVGSGKLRRELHKGKLTAWGVRTTVAESWPKSDAEFGWPDGPPRQKIPADEWPPGVKIDFDGQVREAGGMDWSTRWKHLSFDTEEVLTVWPPSLFQPVHLLEHAPQPLIEAPNAYPSLPAELANDPKAVSAFDAMVRLAKASVASGRPREKRDALAHEAGKQTGYPVGKARKLFAYLPADLRNPTRNAPS